MSYDEYELELLKEIDGAKEFERVENFEEEIEAAHAASRNFLNQTKNINIRLPEYDIFYLKRKSAENNIPYQTIISSLIHQYVSGKIKPKL